MIVVVVALGPVLIVAALVGGAASAAIRRDGSAIRSSGECRLLILADLIDLNMCRFKHGGDLGDLRCLR